MLPHWRALARLRTQLFPYMWAAAQEYQRSGLPIMRHLALAYPGEAAAWGRGDPEAAAAARFEWLFGPDLLVAPVVDMGADGRDVWLPPGELGRRLGRGGLRRGDRRLRAPTPPATPCSTAAGWSTSRRRSAGRPLFVRAGTCLPLLPADVDTLVTDRRLRARRRVVTLADRARCRPPRRGGRRLLLSPRPLI